LTFEAFWLAVMVLEGVLRVLNTLFVATLTKLYFALFPFDHDTTTQSQTNLEQDPTTTTTTTGWVF